MRLEFKWKKKKKNPKPFTKSFYEKKEVNEFI